MRKYMLTLSMSLLLLISCNEEKIATELKSSSLEITLGSICGWCAGGDSLLVTELKTHYEYNTPCDDFDLKKDTVTNRQDWEELTNLLDFEEFKKIDINTCYVCADGCDTWITVNDGAITHTIRFGYDDSLAVQSVRPFIDKLLAIRENVKSNSKDKSGQ
jgi:hypothetical protein